MKAYMKHDADYVTRNAKHGTDGWIELEDGDFMSQLTDDEVAFLFASGVRDFYIEAEDGEWVARPFENLGLFGAQPEPVKRFAKAELRFVRVSGLPCDCGAR